jgi:Domain of unknown function (DUF4062)
MPESVYISSTYKDLSEFRQTVIHCITALSDYYKTVSMEFYDAEDVHFVKKCLDDVEACDIYILILGRRFGYVPKGFSESITELEYEKALLCQNQGMKKEVLVFKVSEMCDSYEYQEGDPEFAAYQEAFMGKISEKLSPRPFDSKAELALQVSHALMKRLFKLIRNGEKIQVPDKENILCYCNRNLHINSMKQNILFNSKRIFFLQANRKADFPGGIVKRFAKYSLGSELKTEPFIKITDLVTSNEKENNILIALSTVLEYLKINVTLDNVTIHGFLNELANKKSRKIILPFYYDFNFSEDEEKFEDFISLLNSVFEAFSSVDRPYELYFIIFIYSEQPDHNTINSKVQKYTGIKNMIKCIEKLKQVTDDDVIDWLERYITSSDYSASIYEDYFGQYNAELYDLQEVNKTFGNILRDMANGDEKIKKYL